MRSEKDEIAVRGAIELFMNNAKFKGQVSLNEFMGEFLNKRLPHVVLEPGLEILKKQKDYNPEKVVCAIVLETLKAWINLKETP